MIISNAQVSMAAQRDYHEEHSVTESLGFLRGQLLPNLADNNQENVISMRPEVDFSRAGSLLANYRVKQTIDLNAHMDSRSRLNLLVLEAMYESITGKPLNVITPEQVQARLKTTSESLDVDTAPPRLVNLRGNALNGLVYQRHERYEEQESMSFQASGVVRTADGRTFDFSVVMNMSREFVQESNLQIGFGGNKVDPLVINFDGLGASLSQTRFEFDLDSDGTTEQIASLRPGSGYLALDKNGDGIINNGSELFGPTSGRGFAELAAYDEDGNNFIDEADSIYHQLRIWMTNDDGSSQLVALGDKNIGAIYLGHTSSPFQLKDAQNNSLGEVVNSGVYLTEDGKVGVIQEINLTV